MSSLSLVSYLIIGYWANMLNHSITSFVIWLSRGDKETQPLKLAVYHWMPWGMSSTVPHSFVLEVCQHWLRLSLMHTLNHSGKYSMKIILQLVSHEMITQLSPHVAWSMVNDLFLVRRCYWDIVLTHCLLFVSRLLGYLVLNQSWPVSLA